MKKIKMLNARFGARSTPGKSLLLRHVQTSKKKGEYTEFKRGGI